MEQLYYSKPYTRNIECTVTSVSKTDNEVLCTTDKTIFYPQCGGQSGDIGYLGSWRVNDTSKSDDGDSILHLEKDAQINEGDVLNLELDWPHRYKYMVMHLCQHMISALLYSMFGIGTTAVHQGPDGLTIETDRPDISDDIIGKLIKRANEVIKENHRVVYHQVSHQEALDLKMRRSVKVEGDVRIVEIEGIDKIACAGVHASSTLEIRLVTYTGSTMIRGHRRLSFKCSDEALCYLEENSAVSLEAGRMLTCSVRELVAKIKSDEEKLSEALRENSALRKAVALSRIEKESANGVFTAVTNESDLSAYARAARENGECAVFVTGNSTGKTIWLASVGSRFSGLTIENIREKVLSLIDGRGGGKDSVFQGSALCNDALVLQKACESFRNLAVGKSTKDSYD